MICSLLLNKVGKTDLKCKRWGFFFLQNAQESRMLLLALRKNNTHVEELLQKLENVGEKKAFMILFITMLMNKLLFSLRNTSLILGSGGNKSELI